MIVAATLIALFYYIFPLSGLHFSGMIIAWFIMCPMISSWFWDLVHEYSDGGNIIHPAV